MRRWRFEGGMSSQLPRALREACTTLWWRCTHCHLPSASSCIFHGLRSKETARPNQTLVSIGCRSSMRRQRGSRKGTCVLGQASHEKRSHLRLSDPSEGNAKKSKLLVNHTGVPPVIQYDAVLAVVFEGLGEVLGWIDDELSVESSSSLHTVMSMPEVRTGLQT